MIFIIIHPEIYLAVHNRCLDHKDVTYYIMYMFIYTMEYYIDIKSNSITHLHKMAGTGRYHV